MQDNTHVKCFIFIFAVVTVSLAVSNSLVSYDAFAEEHLHANLVDIIGTESLSLVNPKAIAINDASQIYVINRDNHRVEIFSDDTRISSFDIDEDFGPKLISDGIDIHDNKVYISDYNKDVIKVFSLNGTPLFSFGRAGSGNGEFERPTDVAVGPDGRIYVTDSGNNRIQMFSSTGEFLSSVTGHEIKHGWGSLRNFKVIDVDNNGRIYLVSGNKDRVHVFEADWTYAFEFGKYGVTDREYLDHVVTIHDKKEGTRSQSTRHNIGGSVRAVDDVFFTFGKVTENHMYLDPSTVIIDRDGITYTITDRHGNTTVFVNEEKNQMSFGEMKRELGEGRFDEVTGITIDDKGWIYVADGGEPEVRIFSNDGILLLVFGDSGKPILEKSWISDIAVSKEGEVYVTHRGDNKVQKYVISEERLDHLVTDKRQEDLVRSIVKWFFGLF